MNRYPLLAVSMVLLIVGCAGKATRPPVTEVTRIPETGNWFCQLGAEGQGWQCVQDPELAEDPRPERLPDPPAEPESAPTDLPVRAEPPSADPQPESDVEDIGSRELPDFARLAYRPPQPVSLMELPKRFYAVQVLAAASRDELERFTRRHQLEGLSSARVERDGELYYVLLLGVYETLETARTVIAGLPPPLAALAPWVRPVGSLQAAMARADALAQSAPP